MKQKSCKGGQLFLIGGAAASCLKRFTQLAGGPKAHIVVFTHASLTPRKAAQAVKLSFLQFGAGKVTAIMPRAKRLLPADATAIYLVGGSQARLVKRLSKELCKQLADFLHAGGLVGGSSAGAAAMPATMIADGMNDGGLKPHSLRLQDGLGFLPNAVIDTHFKERGRFGRLMAAVTLVPGALGVGLDEDTALEIDGKGVAVVRGQGNAWFFQSGERHESNFTARSLPSGLASVAGVEVASLSSGEAFQLHGKFWLRTSKRGR